MNHPQQIKETVRKERGLALGKVRIHIHLPPILDSLHNAALKARKEMLEKARAEGRGRRIHCNVTLTPPWIQLVEASDAAYKKPIPFTVEDGRLQNPANSLAIMALRGDGAFKPYKFLTDIERRDIAMNVIVSPPFTAPPPVPSQALAAQALAAQALAVASTSTAEQAMQ